MPINKKITTTNKLNTIDMAFIMVFLPRKTINGTDEHTEETTKKFVSFEFFYVVKSHFYGFQAYRQSQTVQSVPVHQNIG